MTVSHGGRIRVDESAGARASRLELHFPKGDGHEATLLVLVCPFKEAENRPVRLRFRRNCPRGGPCRHAMGKGRKAKIKKAKKNRREARRVCLHIIARRHTQSHSSSQANPPRFLYSNAEITKRRDPVGVNVLSPHLYLRPRLPLQPGYSRSRPSHHSRCPTAELD
jgi:hypothetical protein